MLNYSSRLCLTNDQILNFVQKFKIHVENPLFSMLFPPCVSMGVVDAQLAPAGARDGANRAHALLLYSATGLPNQ